MNGRKIEVDYVDDATSPGTNTTGAQDLVQNKHVFMLYNNSALGSYTYQWEVENGIPTLGAGYDGTYYGQPGNENIVSAFGNQAPVNGASYTITPAIAKALGAKKMASLGYGISPSSSEAAASNSKYAVPAVGMKAVYTNTAIDFGSTDVGPVVLGIKNSGADSAFYAMNGNTNLAIAQGLKQSGVNMKAELMATGYGQQLLDEPSSSQIGPEVIFTQSWAPVEAKTKATKQFQADLKKYANSTGVPDFGIYTGYTGCDLIIQGLKQQGKNLDQSTFSADLRKLGQVNPAGLWCQDIDISAASYGKSRPRSVATQCSSRTASSSSSSPRAAARRTGPASWSASRSRRPPPPRPRRNRTRDDTRVWDRLRRQAIPDFGCLMVRRTLWPRFAAPRPTTCPRCSPRDPPTYGCSSCRCRRVSPTGATRSTSSGTRSTIARSSTDSPVFGTHCGWSRRRPAAPPVPSAMCATTPSTMS